MTDIRRILELYELYGTFNKVSRELGISHNTVKKYVLRVKSVQEGSAVEILPKDRKIIQPPRILTESVRQKIHSYLESNLGHPRKQRLTAKRIWELLVNDGHKIGYTTVKDEVSRWKRTNSPREVFILQNPREGKRAEFDWGEIHLSINGKWQKFCFAVFVLPFSLYRFARLYTRSTSLEVIHAHMEFFKEINPKSIFYDRMRVVYDLNKDKLNEKFLEFSMHSGFSPCICNPASPHEKGTDEESIGYIRRATFGERSSFASFEEATEWLSKRLAEINAKPVYRRTDVPAQGLIKERDQMNPLPALEYENFELKRAAISRYSLVKCDGNFYSVPDIYRPRDITLKVMIDRVDLLDGNGIIASHERLTGKQQYSLDITHYIKTFHRKPGALLDAKVLAQVDKPIQDLFNRYYQSNPKEFLPILDLMKETSTEALSGVLKILNDQNIPPTHDTLRFLLQQTDVLAVEPFGFREGFEVFEPDLTAFDRMMEE
jgi:transposase